MNKNGQKEMAKLKKDDEKNESVVPSILDTRLKKIQN
jgi:hypothetical protein